MADAVAIPVISNPPSPRMVKCMSNKSVLITGPTSGLGLSLLACLLPLNPSSIVLVSRNEAALNALAKQINKDQPDIKVTTIPCDFNSPSAVASLLSTLPSHNIDLLVLNSGISSRAPFTSTSPSTDDKLMRVNFLSQAAIAKSCVAFPGNRIVWISSVQGFLPLPFRSSYCASKHAVEGYTAAIRPELKALHDIDVHTVSPGYIQTNLSRNAVGGDGEMDENAKGGARPEEVAWEILDRVAGGEVAFDVVPGWKARAARWIQFLAPGVFRGMMEKRATQQEEARKKAELRRRRERS